MLVFDCIRNISEAVENRKQFFKSDSQKNDFIRDFIQELVALRKVEASERDLIEIENKLKLKHDVQRRQGWVPHPCGIGLARAYTHLEVVSEFLGYPHYYSES